MPRKLPPLNALRAFEAAGRHESFSRAAEELNVSHSAISRHVRGLEERLGAQLFKEQARGVALTKAGAQFLADISPAFDRIAEAAERFTEVPAGQVRVSVEPVFATRWLMPKLATFQEQHPEVDLLIDANENLADMARFEADIAIRFFKAGLPDDRADLLSNAPLYPYAAPGVVPLPLSDPEDLLGYPLLYDRPGDMWAQWMAQAGGDPAKVPELQHRMRAFLSVEAAIAGLGVLLVSSEIMQQDVAAGRLVQLSQVPLYSGSYHLIYGEGAMRRRAVRAFRDWLLAETEEFRDPSAPL